MRTDDVHWSAYVCMKIINTSPHTPHCCSLMVISSRCWLWIQKQADSYTRSHTCARTDTHIHAHTGTCSFLHWRNRCDLWCWDLRAAGTTQSHPWRQQARTHRHTYGVKTDWSTFTVHFWLRSLAPFSPEVKSDVKEPALKTLLVGMALIHL